MSRRNPASPGRLSPNLKGFLVEDDRGTIIAYGTSADEASLAAQRVMRELGGLPEDLVRLGLLGAYIETWKRADALARRASAAQARTPTARTKLETLRSIIAENFPGAGGASSQYRVSYNGTAVAMFDSVDDAIGAHLMAVDNDIHSEVEERSRSGWRTLAM